MFKEETFCFSVLKTPGVSEGEKEVRPWGYRPRRPTQDHGRTDGGWRRPTCHSTRETETGRTTSGLLRPRVKPQRQGTLPWCTSNLTSETSVLGPDGTLFPWTNTKFPPSSFFRVRDSQGVYTDRCPTVSTKVVSEQGYVLDGDTPWGTRTKDSDARFG